MKETAISHQILLSALMSNTPDHVYFKDLNSRFVWVSDSLARSLGRNVDDVVGRMDGDFLRTGLILDPPSCCSTAQFRPD